MTREAEAEFLLPFFEKAKDGGILVVGEIKLALDERLGRKVGVKKMIVWSQKQISPQLCSATCGKTVRQHIDIK